MDLTFWVLYICAVTYSLSRTVEMCTKPPGCGAIATLPLSRPSPPTLVSPWSPPDPISLSCNGVGSGLDTIIWIRNNSDGASKILNSSLPTPAPVGPVFWARTLTDSPPFDKFPYTYQCVVIGKCCEVLTSEPITINFPSPTTAPQTTLATDTPSPQTKPKIRITSISSHVEKSGYTGFGKVHVSCQGFGDNTTRIHWIRTDKDGRNTTLNTTEVNLQHLPIWESTLLDRPNITMFPHVYYCVLNTNCCKTDTSEPKTITYQPPLFGGCPFEFFGAWKPMIVIPVRSKRSVKFTWTYDADPEDTGFLFNFLVSKELNISTREYVVQGLVPSNPLNVTVTAVKENQLNVSWLRPQYLNGEWRHYIISWRRSDTNEKYKQRNITSSPAILKNLDGLTSYSVILQGVNHVGIGNSSVPVSAMTKQDDPNKNIDIQSILSETEMYKGYGRVHVLCTGNGDNLTMVEWIREDKDGNNVTLNTTSLVLESGDGVWEAELLDRPDTAKFPYTYKCVVKNKCCLAKISSPFTITRSAETRSGGCSSHGVKKPIKVTFTPGKRSVNFSWVYDADPEDTGFSFGVVSASPTIKLNITEREHSILALVPNKRYDFLCNILYGNKCETSSLHHFTTLPDYPSVPKNLTVTAAGNALNVSWLPPKYPNGEMQHYILSWRNRSDEGGTKYTKKNVSSSPYLIKDLAYFTSYSIKLQAVNNVGIGKSSSVIAETTTAPVTTVPSAGAAAGKSSNAGAIAGGVIGAILVVILVVILLLFLRKRMLKKQHNKSVREFHLNRVDNPKNIDILPTEQPPAELDAEPLPDKTDSPEELSYIVLLEDWEIAPDNVRLLDKKLGGGQFGIVKQGLLTTGKDDPEMVAVKTLKDNSNEAALSDLMTELVILKEVNKVSHPNVIKLIGGFSINGKLHVVTEFCSGGDLRHMLLNSRVYPSEENSANYINLASTLNHRQLLKISADISNGMVHLSSQKFVHRDLAARNILIGEDSVAKVSDFGLARDIGGAEEYIRNNQNLLPVKWMALESLIDGRFTTASDVWSYGVLLHEITTLGDEPYKNISPYNIVSHVGSGCRMPQPPQCSDEVYHIMQNCWRVEPTERPTFDEIRRSLQDMLMDSERSYINLAQVVDEGSLSKATGPTNVSIKDGSVRYTTA